MTPLHGSPKFFEDTGTLQLLTPTQACRDSSNTINNFYMEDNLSKTLRYGKCVADCSYLLNNCKSLGAAAFTVVVAPTCATWCPEACKLDAADDFTCFWAFQAKCRSRSLHILLGREPAVDLGWMCLRHVCAHTSSLLYYEGYLAWVTTKLLEKDEIVAAWLEK